MRLIEKAKLDGSSRVLTADSWFSNLCLAQGLRKIGTHGRLMIKGGHAGYPGAELKKLLDDKERGAHVVATTTIDGEKYIAVAWRGKSDKSRKGKKKKYFMSTFLFTDCSTTLPGNPTEKRRHHSDGTRAPSKFIDRPKCIEEYYTGMPRSDIVNRNAQHLIAIEEAIRTTDVRKRFGCAVVGMWDANAWGMASVWSPKYNEKRGGRDRGMISTFVRDVILGEEDSPGLFPKLAPNTVTENEVTGEVHMVNVDPLVHTICSFKDVQDTCRHQRCVRCQREGKRTQTSVYCGYCAITAVRECDRNPTRNAYCTGPNQCFSRHIANCYKVMQKTGSGQTVRDDARKTRPLAIAAPTVVVPGKQSKRQTRSRARPRAADGVAAARGKRRQSPVHAGDKRRRTQGSRRLKPNTRR